MSIPCDFLIIPAKRPGFSHIVWDHYLGKPRRSVCVETEIAQTWAECHLLKDQVMLHALNRLTFMCRAREIAAKYSHTIDEFNALVNELSELL